MPLIENPIRQPKLVSLAGKVIAILLGILCILNWYYNSPKTAAVKGILDLQNQSWATDGIAGLNGEWAFYWNALYIPSSFNNAPPAPSAYAMVPGFWNSVAPNLDFLQPAFGFATYRLKVLCPPSNEPLALKFLTVASAYKLYVNGQQLAEIGKVGTIAATTTPAYQPVIVPVTAINHQLDIVIQVANFNYDSGGLWDFIKLGTQEKINIYQEKNIAEDFFIAGSFFLMGIFYLVTYSFFPRRKSPLYFALFCFLIGMRSLVTGELGINYIVSWNWQLIKHTEFILLYLTVPVASLLSYELFPEEFSKKILRYILIISVSFVAVVLFTSPFIFRYTLKPFQLLMLVVAAYVSYVCVHAVKNRRTGGMYFLAGFVIFFIAIINDILYNSLLIQSTNMLYAGLYILVICQAAALSKQFFKAFIKIEKLNGKLEQKNNELNLKNETIHQTNEQLSKLNAELDTLVFRTSHDLRSPLTSVYAIADVIKAEPDVSARSEYIDFQKKTILRLDGSITEILQYAKNKSTALKYEQVDFEAFVSNALQDHIFSNNSENIERIVEIKQPDLFETDKARLSMILNNLISNGLKHHKLEQEHPFLKIVVHAGAKQAEIEVIDNGKGIAQDQLDQIFDMFYKGNAKSDGSGFGLYIVKEAVQKLGGTIKVESQVDAGTKFCIVVPNGSAN